MTRRFLTVEDVRRIGGSEILVDGETVVTPQALEAAAAAGVVIRTTDGTYAEPEPDRGPDAIATTAHLPHLPEPEHELGGATGAIGAVVTVVGRNRPGVLAEITTALADVQADVENISQRTIDDYFHLVLTVLMPSGTGFEPLREQMERLGGENDYVVSVMHERVFRFMHRI